MKEFNLSLISLISVISGILFLCPIPSYLSTILDDFSITQFGYCICAGIILIFVSIICNIFNTVDEK